MADKKSEEKAENRGINTEQAAGSKESMEDNGSKGSEDAKDIRDTMESKGTSETTGAKGTNGTVAEASGEEPSVDECNRIMAERDSWKAKAEGFWDQYLRARAEMENYRKRTERDMEDRVFREKSGFVLNLLEVLDNFDRFIEASDKADSGKGEPQFQSFYKGVSLIQKQMVDVLAREGVEKIPDPCGSIMDPNLHEAVMVDEDTEDGTHGMVTAQLQWGYTYRGRVLRPSKVKVIR